MAGLVPFNRRRQNLQTPGYNDFYNMLDDFFGDVWSPARSLMRDTFKIDIRESEKAYTLEAELPGIAKNEIDLTADEQLLTISVNREEEVSDERSGYIHRERRKSSMSRSIRLAEADFEGIKANLNNGILTVVVPKHEGKSGAKRIEIE